MTAWTLELRLRLDVANAGATIRHGRDCTCDGRLTPEDCDRRTSAIWALINQRAELARQLHGPARSSAVPGCRSSKCGSHGESRTGAEEDRSR